MRRSLIGSAPNDRRRRGRSDLEMTRPSHAKEEPSPELLAKIQREVDFADAMSDPPTVEELWEWCRLKADWMPGLSPDGLFHCAGCNHKSGYYGLLPNEEHREQCLLCHYRGEARPTYEDWR